MGNILPVADIVRRLYELNPDGVPTWNKSWYLRNKERVHSNIKQWKINNPDKARSQKKPSEIARRARLKGAIGSFTPQEWDNLIEIYNHRCYYCKKKKPLTVDHIIPLSKGGTNFITNIVPACSHCNSSKHNNHKDAQLALNTTPIICL